MGYIDWLPIADMPDALKDGREVLFASPFVPEPGWLRKAGHSYDIAHWRDGAWLVGMETDVDLGPSFITLDSPTHFAEINPPA